MTIKELYVGGIQYKEFLESDIEDYKVEAVKKWDTIVLTEDFEKQIQSLPEVSLLCFMELYCPDCMVLAPVFEKMRELNPNIQYRIVPRQGNEIIQQSIVGEGQPLRIPTIVKIADDYTVPLYVELPEVIKNQIKHDEISEEEAVLSYREGKFSSEVQQQIVAGLTE